MPVGAPYGATAAEPPINMPWYGIDFVNAIKRFFTKYATFSGRASRGEFWWVMLFLFLVSFVFNMLTRASSFFNVLSAIWGLAILVPQIAPCAVCTTRTCRAAGSRSPTALRSWAP